MKAEFRAENEWKNSLVTWLLPDRLREAMPFPVQVRARCPHLLPRARVACCLAAGRAAACARACRRRMHALAGCAVSAPPLAHKLAPGPAAVPCQPPA